MMIRLNFGEKPKIDQAIESILDGMSKLEPDSDEYKKMAGNLETLLRAKGHQKQKTISPDTLLVVAANLIGIVLILKHENIDIITSKALGFVLRGRA